MKITIKYVIISFLFLPLFLKGQVVTNENQIIYSKDKEWYVNPKDTESYDIDVYLKDSINLSKEVIINIIIQVRKICVKKSSIIYLGFYNKDGNKKPQYRGSQNSLFLPIGKYYEWKKKFYFLNRIDGLPKCIKLKKYINAQDGAY